MRKIALLMCLFSYPALAESLSCATLLKRVDDKLQTKGVTSYTLEFVSIKNETNTSGASSGVPPTNMSKGKEVGTCDGGTKRLIYLRAD